MVKANSKNKGIVRASEFLNWYRFKVGSKQPITTITFRNILIKMNEYTEKL